MTRVAKPSGRRRRTPKPLSRKASFREPKRTFVVLCEGERTEPEYFSALKHVPAVRDTAAVDIRVQSFRNGATPLTLVRKAADLRQHLVEEKGEIDEVWCVFDVEWPDNHPNLPKTIEIARANNISLAISNPCFELWLALHFKDQTAWLNGDQALKLRRDQDQSSDKGLDGAAYMPTRHKAKERAQSLEVKHVGDRTNFPDDNPSSGMHRLIEAIEKPQED